MTIDDKDTITLQDLASPTPVRTARLVRDDLVWKTIGVLSTMVAAGRIRERAEAEVLGACLFKVLFPGSIASGLQEALASARSETVGDTRFVRLELALMDARDDVLRTWPWEYLYQPQGRGDGYFLTSELELLLVRHLDLPIGAKALPMGITDPPLRLLLVAAKPRGLGPVADDWLRETLETLERNPANRMTLSSLVDGPGGTEPNATLDAFKHRLADFKPHVVHFVGHGQVKDGKTTLILSDLDGNPHFVDEFDLANELVRVSSLKLVFLQACESGGVTANPYAAVSGVAMRLANRQIPAVVGWQYPMANGVANRFAGAFYESLMRSSDIDVAVHEGRRELRDGPRDWGERQAFGSPVLYLRALDPLLPVSGATSALKLLGQPQPGSTSSDGLPKEMAQVRQGSQALGSLLPERTSHASGMAWTSHHERGRPS